MKTTALLILLALSIGPAPIYADDHLDASENSSPCLNAATEKLFLISVKDAAGDLHERLPEETETALDLVITIDDLGPEEKETVAIHPQAQSIVFNRPIIESACREINEAMALTRETLTEILGFQAAPTLIHEAAHENYNQQWGDFETTQEEEIEAFGWEILAFIHLKENTPQSYWISTKITKFEERLAGIWQKFGAEGLVAYVQTDPTYQRYPSLQKREDVVSRMVAYEESKQGNSIWTDPKQIEGLQAHYQNVYCDLSQIHCLESGQDCSMNQSICRKNKSSTTNIYEYEEDFDIPQ